MVMTEEELNSISGIVVDSAIQVHRALGPGLLESAYEACLIAELEDRGLRVESQIILPIVYRSVSLGSGYRLDLLVQDEVIVEVKSVAALLPVHESQLLSYLRLSGRRLGLLINFNVPLVKDGIKRLANHL